MTDTTLSTAPTIALYGPRAVALGVVGSVLAAACGAGLAAVAGAGGNALAGGASAGGLLAASWLMAWLLASLTGPYQLSTAGMAWLALSTARLLVLVVAGIALALAAPTMGLGLWLALLLGGLAAVAIDSAIALRAFRQTHPGSHDSNRPASGGAS